jgi:hypothetical protein
MEKKTPRALEKLKDLMDAESFEENLQAAVEDPKCEAARAIMLVILPLLLNAGKKLQHHICSSELAKSHFLAMTRSFGTPAWFLTVNPVM